MLSILVPIYNYSIVNLATYLSSLFSKNDVEYEIIFADDCSNNKQIVEDNSSIINMPNTSYIILDNNLGRAKIRNFLADKAKGEWLLFLDCDCLPLSSDFIINYLAKVDNTDVLCGGTKYSNKSLLNKDYLLHDGGLEGCGDRR